MEDTSPESFLNTTPHSPLNSSTLTSPILLSILSFAKTYSLCHGYISLVVCIIGVLLNSFNIVVLTRKQLISPTNYFLTALAIADLLTMLSYIPISIHFYIQHPPHNTYKWVLFLFLQVNFSVTFHTVSIWLAVTLSAFRYFYLTNSIYSSNTSCFERIKKKKNSRCESTSRACKDNSLWKLKGTWSKTKLAVYVVYICSVLVLVPNYITLKIQKTNASSYISSEPIYELVPYSKDCSDSFRQTHNFTTDLNQSTTQAPTCESSLDWMEVMDHLNYWVQAMLVKLIPCLLMIIYGVLLVKTLRHSHKKSKKLLCKKLKTSMHSRLFIAGHGVATRHSNEGSVEGKLKNTLPQDDNQTPNQIQQLTPDLPKQDGHQNSISPISKARQHSRNLFFFTNLKKKRLAKLMDSKNSLKTNSQNGDRMQSRMRQKQREHTRTTTMLVVIVVLFLLTELPQGVISLMVAYDSSFFPLLYVPLGDLFDILALVNNGINFALYCCMSKRFRGTFLSLFCHYPSKVAACCRWVSVFIYDEL